tara:strand:+ start:123 stop:650 length:528 start_codon:yes stop_codon:yes gene_type:complete
MNSVFVNRIIRACKLDVSLYEEVEADKSATLQAAIVVVLSITALGIGAFLTYGAFNVLIPIIAGLLGWFVTSLLIYFVGAKLFPDQKTQSNLGELLRTIGFSYSPGLIRAFSFNQDLLVITFYGSGIWSLIAMIIAVRQALDYQSTWRAVGVVAIVALFQAYVAFKLGLMPSGNF